MYINMECKQSYWEDTKPSVNIENNSYHGNKDNQSRKSDNASPLLQPSIHDDICKEENSIYQYCDRSFNFSANIAGGITSEEDDYQHNSPKRKIAVTRDPISHRIIEKRRRDRMNNCLADLSRLIPAEYLKKGRGRIEKTEIIEMAIKHMKFLQDRTCGSKTVENCETKADNGHQVNATRAQEPPTVLQEQYRFGYQDCLAETMHFLVELEGFYPSDTLCVKLMNHLQKYYEKIAQVGKSVYSSPLENVAFSNSFQPQTNDYQINSFDDMNKRSRRNSVIQTDHSDDISHNESINRTSQLREMLMGPHLNSLYPPANIRPNIVLHPSPEYSPSSSESTHADISSSSHSLFKFKNYIKERFSAERSNPQDSSSSSQTQSSTSSVVVYTNREKCKTEFVDEPDRPITPTDPHRQVPRIEDHYTRPIVSRLVPVFALHAKGAFYIPLSIDSNLLTPFLTELNNDYGVNSFSSSMVLHPVTISVNFSRPLASKSNECKASVTPAIAHHSTSRLHMVPECR